MPKHKIDAYIGIFEENLKKLCKKIKKARKDGKLTKEQIKSLIAEAKSLRKTLRGR